MIWHPLTLAILLAEAFSLAIYAAAAGRLFLMLPRWQTGGDDADQLERERNLETIYYQARWVFALQALSFVLLIAGISNVWPKFVPGAMCGTGVLQALGGFGGSALFYKLLTLAGFYCWYALGKIQSQLPEARDQGVYGRLLLAVAPFMVLGLWSLFRALSGLQSTQPVSCCAAVYDLVLNDASGSNQTGSDPFFWIITGIPVALVAILWGWRLWMQPRVVKGWARWPAAVLWAALPLAYMVATRVTAPYVLEVLHHPCPWCLLLKEHWAPGVLLFGLPIWVALEGLVVIMASYMAEGDERMALYGLQRIRRAGRRITVAVGVWLLATSLPAFWWYFRFGDWIR